MEVLFCVKRLEKLYSLMYCKNEFRKEKVTWYWKTNATSFTKAPILKYREILRAPIYLLEFTSSSLVEGVSHVGGAFLAKRFF